MKKRGMCLECFVSAILARSHHYVGFISKFDAVKGCFGCEAELFRFSKIVWKWDEI